MSATQQASKPSQLVIRELTLRYRSGAPPAVERLDLECLPGELLALLGPSGSGKSSTLLCIAGLLAPEHGDIVLDGHSLLPLPPERRRTALVFQQAALFPHLPVQDNIAFGLQMRGVARPERLRQAQAMLEAVQLAGYGARKPRQLSGGQQQRVALARALITQPRLLLLDEPFAALDPQLRDEMRTLVRQLQRQAGVTTLCVTHDQAEAAAIADRIALLIDGRLQQLAPAETMYLRPANPVVAKFFGAGNLLPGSYDAAAATALTAIGPLHVASDAGSGPATVMIRPEHVQLHTTSAGLTAEVRDCSFVGSGYRYTVAINGTLLSATRVDAPFRKGDCIGVTLPAQYLWVMSSDGEARRHGEGETRRHGEGQTR